MTRPPLVAHHRTGAGPAVLLIPGMEGSHHFWRAQTEALSDRFDVVACSYPRRRPRPSSRVADYAAAMLRLADALSLERFAVVGESFGGLIAQELTLEHPERVTALVLCNTVDRPRPGGLGVNAFTLASLAHPLAFLAPRPLARELLRIEGRHRGFVFDPSPGNAVLADYILDHGMDPGLLGYLDRMIAAAHASYTTRLPEIRVPTLVLRGDEDRVVVRSTADRFARAIPGAELVVIPEGGHCCQVSCPEPTNRALREFLIRALC